MKFSMKVRELRDYLRNLDPHYDNYEVLYLDTSSDGKCFITKTKINNKDE